MNLENACCAPDGGNGTNSSHHCSTSAATANASAEASCPISWPKLAKQKQQIQAPGEAAPWSQTVAVQDKAGPTSPVT